MKIVRMMLLVALAAAIVAPAGAQPVTVKAGLTQTANGYASRSVVIGNQLLQFDNWNFNVYTNRTADNSSGTPTVIETYSANVQYFGCVMNNCTNWDAYANNLPSTVLSMDPLGNSVTIKMTLTDSQQTPQQHQFTLTFSRPQSTWEYNSLPNLWVDGVNAGAGTPYVALSRSGYIVNGTIDNVTLVNTPSGPCSGTCGYTSGNASQAFDGASLTFSSN